MRNPKARVWVKIWVVGSSLEVMVSRGKVRVILREPGKPATVAECDVEEVQIEETIKDLTGGFEGPGLTG